MNQSNIRNFAIIAHIDHGKSTLADRLLEVTGTIAKRDMQEQILDSNPIERERGITIKLAPVRMIYRLSVFSSRFSDTSQSVFSQPVSDKPITDKPKSENRQPRTDDYILNLIDTPGHVDFNYEVSRSLQACEGALLVVDATQGVQAQTLANLNLARKLKIKIIPLINKIDLPNAQIDQTTKQLENIGFDKNEIILISAKTGRNIEQVLQAIVERIPAPQGDSSKPLRALVFSSQYDKHKGVVCYVRVVDGEISPQLSAFSHQTQPHLTSPFSKGRQGGVSLRFLASRAEVEPIEVGYFIPQMHVSGNLLNGEVGYIATGLKDVSLAKVGDTITISGANRDNHLINKSSNQLINTNNNSKSVVARTNPPAGGEDEAISSNKDSLVTRLHLPEQSSGGQVNHNSSFITPLPGYKEPKPMVFLGLFPINADEYPQAREALGKLKLSDSAFSYRPISSLALGNGFHCGFLGLLHAEVVQERLSREFNLSLLATAPSVEYKISLKNKPHPTSSLSKGRNGGVETNPSYSDLQSITSASEYPDPSQVTQAFEPVMQVTIFSPKKYLGAIMQLCQDKRGDYIDLKYLNTETQVKHTDANQNKTDEIVHTEIMEISYLLPLSEMIVDFFDKLKSSTEGYASMTYEFFDYQPVNLVKLDILLNHEKVDAFSQLVVEERAIQIGKIMVTKLKDVIPRHQFAVPIQATIGGTIVAREDVKPFRKDVLQKLYGGDRTRKDKLLEAQKKGKKKMKLVGRVEIPQEAFLKVFKTS